MNKKQLAGYKAAERIKEGMILGLGTGSTVYYMIEKLGDLVSLGLNIKGVATSVSTTKLAEKLAIPLIDINDVEKIDLAIDGVDEIDDDFNAIKGGGGALLREKIVAHLASEVIWIMDDSKLVNKIGGFPLPVEIIRYGYPHTISELESRGLNPVLRAIDNQPFITDNNNYIVDLHLGADFDINHVITSINNVIGVVENGLFLNLCDQIIIGSDEGVKVIENLNKVKNTK